MVKRIVAAFAAAALVFTAAAVPSWGETQSYPVMSANFDDGSNQTVYSTGASLSRLDSQKYHSAGYSLQIYGRTETWNAAEFDMGSKMKPGNTYRMSAWIYHEGDEAVTVQLSFKVNDGASYTYCRQQHVEPGEWTYVLGKYTVGEDETVLRPYIEVIDSTDPFWVDDISIVQTGGYRADTSVETDIMSLKDAFEGTGITVGASIGSTVFAGDATGEQKELILKHFDTIALENELKAQMVLDYDESVSDLGKYNESAALDFSAAAPILGFAKENGLKVSAQALVWHSMTPEWFFHVDYDTSKPLAGRELMLSRLENYIKGVLTWCHENYPGLISSWVVVNEAVDGDANPFLRQSNWLSTIGEDYVAKAFEYAYMYRQDDGIRLLYNDYNMEYYYEKTEFALKYLNDYDLISKGWIDGIGFQCHMKMTWPGINEIKKNLDLVKAEGLEVEITEIDMALGTSDIEQYGSEFLAFRAQRQRYAEVIKTFLEAKEDGLKLSNITWWGLTDGYTWLVSQYGEAQYPLLFDENNKAKPAFYGVLDALGKSEAPENIALNRPANASGVQGVLEPGKAVDGDRTGESRWASQTSADGAQAPYTGEFWWYVDLGENSEEFNSIVIYWEVCYAKSYVIQTKDSDPESPTGWTDITGTLSATGSGRQEILFDEPINARYVRMFATEKATNWGCSMYEFEVYFDPSAVEKEEELVYIGEDTEDIPLSDADGSGNEGDGTESGAESESEPGDVQTGADVAGPAAIGVSAAVLAAACVAVAVVMRKRKAGGKA